MTDPPRRDRDRCLRIDDGVGGASTRRAVAVACTGDPSEPVDSRAASCVARGGGRHPTDADRRGTNQEMNKRLNNRLRKKKTWSDTRPIRHHWRTTQMQDEADASICPISVKNSTQKTGCAIESVCHKMHRVQSRDQSNAPPSSRPLSRPRLLQGQAHLRCGVWEALAQTSDSLQCERQEHGDNSTRTKIGI